MVGHCSCGLFHIQGNTSCFYMPDNDHHYSYDETIDMYSFTSATNSSSSVDCTLSLGTPSTRLSDQDDHDRHRNCSSYMNRQSHRSTTSRSGRNNGSSSTRNSTNDLLLARRCANCDTTSTPLWRNGPRGPKSLCNACGIRFKKEERRGRGATVANASGSGGASSSVGVVMEEQQQQSYNNSWVHHHNTGGIPFLSWQINVTD